MLGGPRPDTGVWRNWNGPIFHAKAWADLKRERLRQGSSDWRGLMPSGIQTALAIQNELESGVHPQGLLSLTPSLTQTNQFLHFSPRPLLQPTPGLLTLVCTKAAYSCALSPLPLPALRP